MKFPVFKYLANYLPVSIQRRVALKYLEQCATRSNLMLALYDPITDLLRLPEIHEAISILDEGVIADSLPWMSKVKKYIPENAVVFDVGGFRGITTQWFSRIAGLVYTFEPMPANAHSIRTALGIRNITNVVLNEIAVSDALGISDFHLYMMKGHNSLGRVNTSKYIETIKVPTTTLDEFSANRNITSIDFLKIDVEGFEFEVLNGARGLLATGNVAAILFEANRPVLKSLGKSIMPIYDLLRSNSYHVTDLDGRIVTAADLDACEFGDFLACRTAIHEIPNDIGS